MTKPIEALIDVAAKRRPAQLVIKNAMVFNSFLGVFRQADVAVEEGYVAGVGQYHGQESFDADGGYLCPSFIDSHVHIESGMASPAEFAKTVAGLGTGTIVADPHEIANVAGAAGLKYILDATEDLPINVFVMLPSCVPATPLEWGGAKLTADDLRPFLGHPRVLGLGEMMNYPGVLAKAPEVMAKLHLAEGRQIDGHSPGLTGPELQAYAAAGVRNDHECSTPEEARERLSLGMAVMLRQGSAARNLLNLLPAVDAAVAPFCLFATDDRHPEDLIGEGHINYLVRLAVENGRLDLPLILNMAALNSARHFGLRDIGAIAPGFRADLSLFPDLTGWRPSRVWHGGRLAAKEGVCLWNPGRRPDESRLRSSMNIGPFSVETLRVAASAAHVRVIGLVPGELVTEHLTMRLAARDGQYQADPDADLAKIAVVERHRASGDVGLGFLKGLGLKRGAIASTVAHDSHNLVVAGLNDDDMFLAVKECERIGGGLAVVEGGRVLGRLPLPLGGLLSDRPISEIKDRLHEMQGHARALGLSEGHDPFMTLAFMSLPVIPKLKLTEAGLVDVENFQIVPTVY